MIRKYIPAVLLLLIVFTSQAVLAETVAVMLKVRGNVTVKRGNQTKLLNAKKGLRLSSGDRVVTGKKSFAAIRFIDDASLVRIRANSKCVINAKKESKRNVVKNVFLEVGTIFARVTRQRSRFQISTPTSVASVKGTEFITDQRITGGTFYFGEKGVVEVTNDAGTALLHAGETAFVASKTTAPTVRKTNPGEKPSFDSGDREFDEFEFQFENEDGQKKVLKFNTKVKP